MYFPSLVVIYITQPSKVVWTLVCSHSSLIKYNNYNPWVQDFFQRSSWQFRHNRQHSSPLNMETFAYRFDLDRDYFIDISMRSEWILFRHCLFYVNNSSNRYQSMLPFITLFTFRPFIFLILMKKRDSMPSDVRWAYIINQVLAFCYRGIQSTIH